MVETENLILRPGSEADGEALYRNLWNQPDVFRYMFNNPSPDLEAGLKRTAAYTQMHKEVSTEFFVCDKATGEAIGIAGIKELSPGKWTFTDIAIGPAFQGKGYGKQIVLTLLELVFDKHGAKEVYYDCFADNTASHALARSCGFSYSHSEETELKKNGESIILDYYVIQS